MSNCPIGFVDVEEVRCPFDRAFLEAVNGTTQNVIVGPGSDGTLNLHIVIQAAPVTVAKVDHYIGQFKPFKANVKLVDRLRIGDGGKPTIVIAEFVSATPMLRLFDGAYLVFNLEVKIITAP